MREVNIIDVLQISSVLAGSLVGSPKIASRLPKQRAIGFMFVGLGSLCAFIAQVYVGLYILSLSSFIWLGFSLKGVLVNLPRETQDKYLDLLRRFYFRKGKRLVRTLT